MIERIVSQSRFQLGRVGVTQFVELPGIVHAVPDWFPNTTEEQLTVIGQRFSAHGLDGHGPGAFDAELRAWNVPIRNHVIEVGDTTIVVDACCGNDKQFPAVPDMHQRQTDYLDRFVAAGLSPERVDTVISTHLHADHVGWYTKLVDGRWQPTFPNATYLIDPTDLAYIQSLAEAGRDELRFGEDNYRFVYEESIVPILEQATHELLPSGDIEIASDGQVTVVSKPAPGHTPGHRIVEIAGVEDGIVFTGDVIHILGQAAFPEIAIVSEVDLQQGQSTRRELLQRCADEGIRLLTAHVALGWNTLAQPPIGLINNDDGGFDWTL